MSIVWPWGFFIFRSDFAILQNFTAVQSFPGSYLVASKALPVNSQPHPTLSELIVSHSVAGGGQENPGHYQDMLHWYGSRRPKRREEAA